MPGDIDSRAPNGDHDEDANTSRSSTITTRGLEIGCGVGNLAFPLLAIHPTLHLSICDFSAHAIDLVRKHTDYPALLSANRLTAFVADITQPQSLSTIADASLDFITCVFCLGAIDPILHTRTFTTLCDKLKEGGCLLFRDYGHGDLAEARFATHIEPPRIGRRLYVRQDGTMSYFFTVADIEAMAGSAGLEVVENRVVERVLENRKMGMSGLRCFVQAVLRRKPAIVG